MSRSGYSDDLDDNLAVGRWRAAVKSAIKGRRGQAFLRDLLAALQALPEKKLIAGNMVRADCVCAIGAVGKARGVDMTKIDQMIEAQGEWDDATIGYEVAATFDIASALAREIMFENDEGRYGETDEQRYHRMVRWVENRLRDPGAFA